MSGQGRLYVCSKSELGIEYLNRNLDENIEKIRNRIASCRSVGLIVVNNIANLFDGDQHDFSYFRTQCLTLADAFSGIAQVWIDSFDVELAIGSCPSTWWKLWCS